MSEESTTPDLVELTRQSYEAGTQVEAAMRFSRPDSVWDMTPIGLGIYEGQAAIQRFFEDWFGTYEQLKIEPETIHDLGNGVVFVVVRQSGRPLGSSGRVDLRYAAVFTWVDGLIARITNYADSNIDEARAAAERLAEERG